MAAWLSAKFAVMLQSRSAVLALSERKLGLKCSNHVVGEILTASLRYGEEARLGGPFYSSPRRSAKFCSPLWSVAPALLSWVVSMLMEAFLREAGWVILLPIPDDGVFPYGSSLSGTGRILARSSPRGWFG